MNTPQWQQIKPWLDERLARLRNENDKPDLDHDQTQMLRGKIAMLKELLRLPELLADAAIPDDPD